MKNNDYEINHIKVLDGIRALAILIVVWFHFWQQSWIIPIIGKINLDFIPRYGFLLVDMLILLSGFCLFLPYAKSMVYKMEIPDTKKFFINRIARIIPSYLVSMVVSIIFIVILSTNIPVSFFIKDTITHLTFTNNLFADTLISTNYMVVLWSVALEIQLYLIFTFLAKRFMKHPIITYVFTVVFGIICTLIINSIITNNNISFWVNNTLTFIPVYANGMLGAWLYIKYTKNKQRSIIKDIVFTIISIITMIIYRKICLNIGGTIYELQSFQINYRYLLSCLFLIFMISTIMSHKIYRYLFENKFMKFIAIISFNLYIYHQFIAVKLKDFRIPFWEGDVPPNMTGDTKWQWTYFIYCIVVSLFVAAVMTYLVEKPSSKWIKNKFERKKIKE